MNHDTAYLFLDLVAILVLTRVLGGLAGRLGQPAVIGELLAGVFLLPLLVEHVAGAMFTPGVRTGLSALADLGVGLFMFLVGLELDRNLIRGRGRAAVSIALAATLLPFGLGLLLGVALLGRYGDGHGTGFVLFIGTSVAVTAFPVLARILDDRRMRRTPIGTTALTAAGIGDVLAWILLAVAVAIAGGGVTSPLRLLLVLPYLVVMVWGVRPLLRMLADGRFGRIATLPPVLAGVLLSGGFTEWIGLHFIFGSFLFGVLMPRENGLLLRATVQDRMAELNAILLMPVFFVIAGLQVDFHFDRAGLGVLALILLVAVAGKFLGAFGAARAHRLPLRESTTIGVLMNTRGLTELIVLSVGLQLGLIDARLYTYLVIMALVTTSMAGPLLRLVYPPRLVAEDTVPERAPRTPVRT